MSQLSNRFMFHPYYAPADSNAGGAPSGEMGKEEMIEFLGEEDEPEVIDLEDKGKKKVKAKEGEEEQEEELPIKDKKGKGKEKEDEEEEELEEELEEEDEDELAELEAELEGPDEEQLELKTPVPRREILKKYPNLFKDFPYLETAYYREQQFTELLPTIDDAKKAVEKSDTLDKIERELMSGSTENMLKAVHNENKDAFYRIVDNYLPVLANVDEKAYNHVIGTIIKHTIESMVVEGKKNEANKSLLTAAQLLNQFVFGSSDYEPPRQLSKGKSPSEKDEEDNVTKERREFTKQRFETTRDDLNHRVNNMLKSTIEANIDPKQSMTDYVRRVASRETLESLTGLIERDSRFKALMDRLWEKAFESNFDKESTDRIRKAYVSKAKTLLPSVIKKARNEALKGLGKRVKDEEEQEEREPTVRSSRNNERPAAPKKVGNIKNAKDIPEKMTTLEFLNSD